jgi:hypothetical protein
MAGRNVPSRTGHSSSGAEIPGLHAVIEILFILLLALIVIVVARAGVENADAPDEGMKPCGNRFFWCWSLP